MTIINNKKKFIKQMKAHIKDKLDHYTPYRPLTDCPEARESSCIKRRFHNA